MLATKNYFVKGFSNLSLKIFSLQISEFGLHRFPSSILRLQSLTTINLSGNNLSEIPGGFGFLPLTDINFAQNQLGNSNFAWLRQLSTQNSLKSINLSDNKV